MNYIHHSVQRAVPLKWVHDESTRCGCFDRFTVEPERMATSRGQVLARPPAELNNTNVKIQRAVIGSRTH